MVHESKSKVTAAVHPEEFYVQKERTMEDEF